MFVRPLACGVSITLLSVLFSNSAFAQQRQYAPRTGPSGTLFKKVESLQQSVKQKLKTALGVQPQQTTGPTEESTQHLPGDSADHAPVQEPLQPPGKPTQRTPDSNPQWGGEVPPQHAAPGSYQQPMIPADQISHRRSNQYRTQFQPELATQVHDAPDAWQRGPVVTAESYQHANPGYQDPGYQAAGYPDDARAYQHPMRTVDYNQQQYTETYDRLPPPIAPNPHGDASVMRPPAPAPDPVRRWDDPGPAYQTPRSRDFAGAAIPQSPANLQSNLGGPLPRGSVLGDSPITATQHAIRLVEENGDLKARLAMLDAENKRLKEKLLQSERLLDRSTEAVESAHQEIDALSATNRDLQTKLTDSEQRYNRHLMETDRMLQSIREELDGVLVREISAKGN